MTMAEDFSSHRSGLTSPARDAAALTPDDVTPLSDPVRALYVGGGGSLRARMVSGAVVDFADMPGGAIYPLRLSQIMASGTTATGLVGLR
jgi:hypothetical protein